MPEKIIKDLNPVIKLSNQSRHPVLVVTGLPYSGKSIGITSAITAIPAIQQVKTVSRIDDLMALGKINGRIHLELPKDLTKENIKHWKDELDKFLLINKNVTIEGRSYVVKCLLSNDDLFPLNQQENIVMQFFRHLLTLKNTYVGRLPVQPFQLNKEDAISYLNQRGSSFESNDVLEYSRMTDGSEEAYIPLLLDRGVEIVNEYQNYKQTFEQVKQDEKALSLDREQLEIFMVSQLQTLPVQEAANIAEKVSSTEALQGISDGASAAISSIGIALTPMFPLAALIPIAMFVLRFANNYRQYTGKKGSIEQLIMFRRAWENLCDERKVIIGYTYDQAMKLIPGTAMWALNSFFLESESESKFKMEFESVREDIKDLFDRIDSIEKTIKREIQKIKEDILNEKGIITDISQLGFKYEEPRLMCRAGTGINETYVEVVISNEYQELQEEIRKGLDANKIVILTGPNGIGKSILSRHLICNFMTKRVEVVFLDKVPEERISERLGESRDRIVLYDPFSPEIYLPRKEIQGMEYSGMNTSDVSRKIKSLINSESRALVVLPRDIWKQVKLLLSTNVQEFDIQAKLKTRDFLKGMIVSYSQKCTPPSSELDIFVNRLMLYEAGYTLVAAYLGRWLDKSGCVVEDIHQALMQAQNEPVRFLQNYVWAIILRRDYDLARRIALPLVAHVHMGAMTTKMASDLPLALKGQNLAQLDPSSAEWIAIPHEDLMELALKNIVLGNTNETNSPELREMIRAILNTINDISTSVPEGTKESSLLTILFIQQWLGEKLNSLSTRDLEELLEFYASCLIWADKEVDKDNSYIEYFYEEQKTPAAGLKALIGIPYNVNDLIARLNTEKDFCKMLCEVVRHEIHSIGEAGGLEIFLRALSYVAGASTSTEELTEKCLIQSLSLINLASDQFRSRAQVIYWQTGKRIMTTAQAYSKRNDMIAKLLTYYFYVLVISARIRLEDSAIEVLESFSKSKNWISRTLYIIISLRRARENYKKEEFHSLLANLTSFCEENDDSSISHIAVAEAGWEVVMSYDSFNEPNDIPNWFARTLGAIRFLRTRVGRDDYITEWLNASRYFTEAQIDKGTFDNWLGVTEFRTLTLEARIAYRNNDLEKAQNKFEYALTILLNLTHEEYNNILQARLDVERIKAIRGELDREALEAIWTEAKSKQLYVNQNTISQILSNYIQLIGYNNGLQELIRNYREYLELNTIRLCTSYHKLLTTTNSNKSSIEIEFYGYLKRYAQEIAAPFMIAAEKYIEGEINWTEALKSCSLSADPNEKSLCNNLMLAIKGRAGLHNCRFLFHKSHVYTLLEYPDFVLAGLSLLRQSTGVVVLLLFASAKKDSRMIRELIRYGKNMFKVPVFTYLCDNLLNALNNEGIESGQFATALNSLVLTALI